MKLLLIAPSTRAMAESARRAGYSFVTLDFFGDADQKKICENYSLNHEFKEEYSIENLFKHSQELDFTHVVYGSGFENHPDLVGKLEKMAIVLGNDSEALRKVRNWNHFFKALKKHGILFPETKLLPLECAREFVSSNKGWIIKPVKTGGGHSIYDAQTLDVIEEDKELEDRVLVQEYIPGKPVSSTIVVSEESVCIGSARQLVGAHFNKYRYVGNIAPLDTGAELLEELSCEIGEIFKLKGVNGIDFILSDELYVLEVNPRLTGSMEVIEKAYKLNVLDLHIKACTGEKLKIKKVKPKTFYGKKIIYADRKLRFNIRKTPDFVKDIPHSNERIEADSPVCTVLGAGKTAKACYKNLITKEEKLSTCYENSRKSNL